MNVLIAFLLLFDAKQKKQKLKESKHNPSPIFILVTFSIKRKELLFRIQQITESHNNKYRTISLVVPATEAEKEK